MALWIGESIRVGYGRMAEAFQAVQVEDVVPDRDSACATAGGCGPHGANGHRLAVVLPAPTGVETISP